MTTTQPQRQDWTAAWVAFVVALFAWGAGFYGLPMFVHTLHESREWSISLMSMAVTTHFLLSAILVANLPRVHHRLGVTHTTLGGTGLLAAAHVGTAVALATSINQAVFAFAPALFGVVRDNSGSFSVTFALASGLQLCAALVVRCSG